MKHSENKYRSNPRFLNKVSTTGGQPIWIPFSFCNNYRHFACIYNCRGWKTVKDDCNMLFGRYRLIPLQYVKNYGYKIIYSAVDVILSSKHDFQNNTCLCIVFGMYAGKILMRFVVKISNLIWYLNFWRLICFYF